MNDAFEKDCLDILAGKAERGEISRRRFAQLAAMLLGAAPLGAALDQARSRPTSNSCSSIGAATRSRPMTRPMAQPFLKETGIAVKEDGTGPTEGRNRRAVQERQADLGPR